MPRGPSGLKQQQEWIIRGTKKRRERWHACNLHVAAGWTSLWEQMLVFEQRNSKAVITTNDTYIVWPWQIKNLSLNHVVSNSGLTCFNIVCSCDDLLCEVTQVVLSCCSCNNFHVMQCVNGARETYWWRWVGSQHKKIQKQTKEQQNGRFKTLNIDLRIQKYVYFPLSLPLSGCT